LIRVSREKAGCKIRVHKDEEALLLPILQPLVQSLWVEFTRRYSFAPKLPLSIELYKESDNFSVRTFRTCPSADPGMLGVTFSRVVTGRSPGQGKVPWGLDDLARAGPCVRDRAVARSGTTLVYGRTIGVGNAAASSIVESSYPRRGRGGAARWQAAVDGRSQHRLYPRAFAKSRGRRVSPSCAGHFLFWPSSFGFPKIVEALRLYSATESGPSEVLEKIYGTDGSPRWMPSSAPTCASSSLPMKERSMYGLRTTQTSMGLKLQMRNAPQNAKLHGLLAVAMVRSGGDPAEVAGEIAVSRKLDPRCKEAILADAELNQKLGKKAEAEKLFQELISVGGDGFDVRQRLG
jgi:hypothetical protein